MDDTAVPPSITRFRIAIGVVCLVLAGMAVFIIRGGNWVLAIAPALAIVGLVRRVRWGRTLSLVMMGLLLVAGVGLMLPSAEYDQLTGSSPRPMEDVLTQSIGCMAVALLCLHLLGVYKKAFRPDWF